MLRRLIAVLGAAIAFASLVVPAAPASAEPNPPGCPKEYFCAYSGINQTGTLVLATKHNWSGFITNVYSIFNNGIPWPGYDHVQVEGWYGPHLKYRPFSICLHYNPGPGMYKFNLTGDSRIEKVTWRGEC